MRIRVLASLCAASALAYPAEMATGYFRGSLVGWEGSLTAGVISAADKNNEVFTCQYDSKSFIELDHWHVKVDKLLKGDLVKILADRKVGEQACYIRSLTVEEPPKPIPMIPGHRPSATPTAKAAPIRHGRENIAGVVTEISATSLTLRTRDGERMFVLLPETRYLGNGLKVERADVHVNQRLSVETSQDLKGAWEAYQLTWGDLTVR